jgi:hypothetical protein
MYDDDYPTCKATHATLEWASRSSVIVGHSLIDPLITHMLRTSIAVISGVILSVTWRQVMRWSTVLADAHHHA